jgi:predicted PurR-regulated permease PerM
VRSFFTRNTVFFLLISFLCFFVLYPYILQFIFGISLAYLYEPLQDKIIHVFKFKNTIWKWIVSVSLVFITLLAIIGPILTLVTTGIQELVSLLNILENELKEPIFIDDASKSISLFLDKFSIHYSAAEVIVKGTDVLKKVATFAATGAGTALSATPAFIIKTVVMLLTWVFFLVQGKYYRNYFLPKVLPLEKEREMISKTISSVLKALIVANVLVSCIQAILITSSLALFGIPRYALMGIIAFFASFIPVIGTAPVMIGAAAWCYFSQGRLGASIGILICAVLVSLLDNVLRPYFMKGGADLNFFWIFLAIVGGMSQFGISGAVLGPVCFALFVAAIKAVDDEPKISPIQEQEVPNP